HNIGRVELLQAVEHAVAASVAMDHLSHSRTHLGIYAADSQTFIPSSGIRSGRIPACQLKTRAQRMVEDSLVSYTFDRYLAKSFRLANGIHVAQSECQLTQPFPVARHRLVPRSVQIICLSALIAFSRSDSSEISNAGKVTTTRLSSCSVLNQAGTNYVLQQDIAAVGTCFSVQADDVTLDLNGHSVTYASDPRAKPQYGV